MKLANDMSKFYLDKVESIRKDISQINPIDRGLLLTVADSEDESAQIFSHFNALDLQSLENIIKSMSSKGHPNDPVPVWVIKKNIKEMSPFLLPIVNRSFHESTFPESLKHALVTPVIKDKDGDRDDFKNYRPVSNLTFLSKLIEKCAFTQLNDYLLANNLYPKFQSAYRKGHSCETALLKIVDDIQSYIAEKKMVALITLDLSSAFDTIDHEILLLKLKNDFRISGPALNWMKSYLSNRSFAVRIINVNGQSVILVYGVPQGSILGPLLFVLYVHDVIGIAQGFGLDIHLYADDSQLYVGFCPLTETTVTMHTIISCLQEIEKWMHKNFLKINIDKTNVIFFGRSIDLQLFSVDLTLENPIKTKIFESKLDASVKTLGVMLDSRMSMQQMVAQCCKTGYFNLSKLQSIRHCLDYGTKVLLVQSTVLSRLDYCNVLLANLPKTYIAKLQRVINASVRFIFNLSKRDHVTVCAKRCHFLPVWCRIKYKACVMIYKIVHKQCPDYLLPFVQPVMPYRDNLRSSSDTMRLQLPNTEKSLKYSLIEHWNELPLELRMISTLDLFRSKLKTHFFILAYQDTN